MSSGVWLAFLSAAVGAAELVDPPPTTFAALALAAFRLTALVVAVGALPHVRIARALAGIWLAIEIAMDYVVHVRGGVEPTWARGAVIAFAVALILLAPWTRGGGPAPDASRALRHAWRALAVLAAVALSGALGVSLLRDASDGSLFWFPPVVVALAFPVSIAAVALVSSAQTIARTSAVARIGATLLTAAVLLELLQGVALYRVWSRFHLHEPSFEAWLGGAALLGPILQAVGLLLLGIACETLVRGRGDDRPWQTTSYVLGAIGIVVAAMVLALHTLPLHPFPDPITETEAWPAIVARSAAFVALPWVLALLTVPALRRAASFGPDDRVPPQATAR